jgi:FG-GAP repeat protein/centrosomal CEP192-like protein
VIGANNSRTAQGAAYVFAESGGAWTQQAELTASPDGTFTPEFGYSVALNGSSVVIGAPYHTVGSNQAQGVVYVFAGSGGTWSQQAELTASDGEAGDFFGQSVAVGGSTAVMGAPCHPRNGFAFCQGGPGAAYVFVESGGTWSQQAELAPSDGALGDEFGISVSFSGSTIVTGASLHTVGSNQGAAYVFTGSGGTWSQQAELAASDGVGGYFGWSVAVDGSTAVMGAPAHVVGSNSLQGAAYVFGASGPLFTLSAAPNTLSVLQGTQATSTITITPENGFNGSVSLSASGLPSGVTAVFNPNPATSTSTLTFTASATATTGTATVIVAGASGSLAQTTTLTLTVTQAVPTAVLSPTSLNFGNQGLDTKSHPQAVTLTNSGTGTLYIYNVGISPSTDFNISNKTCGSSLPAGSNCQVSVDFKPKVLGPLSASLIFGDNAANSPQTVSLSGTGVAATLTPPSATYSKQKVGATSKPKTFTLTNDQTVPLTSIAISTTGDFAVSATTCTTSLTAKGKCTISVTFTPRATGKRTGQLSVSDSASNSPQTSNLTGTGE